jgi:rfaE bifunctional protein nucleotidyltransferase chain/domain
MKLLEPSWESFYKKKVIEPSKLGSVCQSLKDKGHTLATLNGSFDLLHAGHLYILYEASKVADILIVALNSDASIKGYKGPKRPIISLDYRIQLISALSFVDFVTWFDESDPRELIKTIRPDIHVNGAEYGSNCIEADVLSEIGGKLHLVDRIPGLATSHIVERIKCV